MSVITWMVWIGGAFAAADAKWGFWASVFWPYYAGMAIFKMVNEATK